MRLGFSIGFILVSAASLASAEGLGSETPQTEVTYALLPGWNLLSFPAGLGQDTVTALAHQGIAVWGAGEKMTPWSALQTSRHDQASTAPQVYWLHAQKPYAWTERGARTVKTTVAWLTQRIGRSTLFHPQRLP